MPEPISSSLAVVAGTALVTGVMQEVGRQVVVYVCNEKVVEAGWQRHDEANESCGTGLSQRKAAQA